jgi:ACDE family multidrug resistance protein
VPRLVLTGRLLSAVFAFSFGTAAWSAVVVGRLVQVGEGALDLGSLFACCEVTRLPGVLLLPLASTRYGVARVARTGLLILPLLPLMTLLHPDRSWLATAFVLGAVPSMAVYVGLPALALGTAEHGREGPMLAWMALAGGAGGTLGPWAGGLLADRFGFQAGLLVLSVASCVALAALAGLQASRAEPEKSAPSTRPPLHGLLVLALSAALFASAADASAAALIPVQLFAAGLSLGEVGFVLSLGAAVAGIGLGLIGWVSRRWAPSRVVVVGLIVLGLGSLGGTPDAPMSPLLALTSGTMGLGNSAIRLGATLALAKHLGTQRAAHATSLIELVLLTGRMVGPLGLGQVAEHATPSDTFALIAILALAAPAGWLLWLVWMRVMRRSSRAAGAEAYSGIS